MSFIPCQSRVLAIVIPAVRLGARLEESEKNFRESRRGPRCLEEHALGLKRLAGIEFGLDAAALELALSKCSEIHDRVR